MHTTPFRRAHPPLALTALALLFALLAPRSAWAQLDASVADASPTDATPDLADAASQSNAPASEAVDAGIPDGAGLDATVATDASSDVAAEPATGEEPGITVRGDLPVSTATEGRVRDRDLALRPRTRPGDLLEVAPGLLVVQHAGGGKANQYFLRGFDADHGSDIALSVDGVPFNNPSHGHGQGYADPHFIIPELVERVDVQEGPYHVTSGDFATAGAIDLQLRRTLPQSFATIEGGMYNRLRFVGGARTDVGPLRGYVAAELSHNDGPFVNPQAFNRFNVLGRFSVSLAPNVEATLSASAYGGFWNASGQVPTRETDAGRLSPFGSIDPTEGGQSERQSVWLEVRARGANSESSFLAYVTNYRLSIFSNFTFFARNPTRGDMIEQNDARVITGFRAVHRLRHQVQLWTFQTLFGAQFRFDSIENALHYDQARVRFDTPLRSQIRQALLGVFAEEQIAPRPWLRLLLGVRADLFLAAVEDIRVGPMLPDPAASGTHADGIVSPKATLVLNPWRPLDLYFNFGSGFHSNDARGVVLRRDAVTPLTRALGYELGARIRVGTFAQFALAAWLLDMDSEIVWVGDEGTTETRGPTRRLGLTGEARVDFTLWLRGDLDVTLVNATFTQNPGNANAVALAPPFTLTAGVSARHPIGLFGALRLRAIGPRPATEDRMLTAQGFAVVSAQFGYRHRYFEASISAENLFNTPWREAQFANESRLPTEGMPVRDVHYTPGTPIAISGRLTGYLP